MRIAICEDDHDLRERLTELLRQKESPSGSHFVKSYASGDQLWFDYQDRPQPFDLILMDIELPGELNGLETAKHIRACGDRVPIVILTAYRKYALAGYEVRPWQYLLKPVDASELYSIVDQIEEQLTREWGDCLNLPVAGGYLRIPFDDIFYLENRLHNVLIHTRGECYKQYRKMSEILELCDKRFIICHKSYAVNAEKIRHIGNQFRTILLENDDIVPISSQRKPDFISALARFDSVCHSIRA